MRSIWQTTYLCFSSQQLNFFLWNVCCYVTQFRLCVDYFIMHSCGSLIKLMPGCGCLMTCSLVLMKSVSFCFLMFQHSSLWIICVLSRCILCYSFWVWDVFFYFGLWCSPNFYVAFVCNGEYAVIRFLYFISWFGHGDHVALFVIWMLFILHLYCRFFESFLLHPASWMCGIRAVPFLDCWLMVFSSWGLC